MRLDLLLPLILFLISVIVLFIYSKYEMKVRSLFEEKEIRTQDAVLMVVVMGIMITIMAFIPQQAMMILILFANSLLLLLFTYVIAPKWYLAVSTPALFIALYFFHWNMNLSNIFAIIFILTISIFLGSLFTWKSTVAFITLLIIMDIIQVLGTKFMMVSVEKMLVLQLPTMIIIPTFPMKGQVILGLGDILLTNLLSIQTYRRYGKIFGYASCISIAVVFLLAETVLLNLELGFFPATVMIAGGWIIVLVVKYLYKRS